MNMNAVAQLNQLLPGLTYQLVSQCGPLHRPTFTFSVEVRGQLFEGEGTSKKGAKSSAAEKALAFISWAESKEENMGNRAVAEAKAVVSGAVGVKNAISMISELVPGLTYVFSTKEGSSRFIAAVDVVGQTFKGEGKSKKAAKLAASEEALSFIKGQGNPKATKRKLSETPNDGTEPAVSPSKHPNLMQNLERITPDNCVALDCECVEVAGQGKNGFASALARVSIVDFHGNIILDAFSKPSQPVTDYRTWVSGIRKKDIAHANSFHIVQEQVEAIIEGKIVIGHSIASDMKSLEIQHPQTDIRDTTLHPWLMEKAGYQSMRLKRLCQLVLDREIQVGKKGHSSVEDALATMELFKAAECATGRLDPD